MTSAQIDTMLIVIAVVMMAAGTGTAWYLSHSFYKRYPTVAEAPAAKVAAAPPAAAPPAAEPAVAPVALRPYKATEPHDDDIPIYSGRFDVGRRREPSEAGAKFFPVLHAEWPDAPSTSVSQDERDAYVSELSEIYTQGLEWKVASGDGFAIVLSDPPYLVRHEHSDYDFRTEEEGEGVQVHLHQRQRQD